MNLTKKVVQAAAAPLSGQVFLRDDAVTGFALGVLPSGTKTFVFEGRIKGRNRRIKNGQFPDWSVENARTKAESIRGIVAEGGDPADDRLAEKRELTFEELSKEYLTLYAKKTCRSWKRMERRLELHFSRWNARRLSDITPADVAAQHIRIGKERGEIEANRAIELVRTMFNFAKDTLKWRGDNPAKLKKRGKPGDGIVKYPEHERERFLDEHEMRQVNAALAQEPDVYWRAYFALDFMLGLRKGDLLALRWDQINAKSRIVTLPTQKPDKPLTLPLPAAALRILRELPRREDCPWVFPGIGKTGHLVEPKKAWKRIRTAAKVPDVIIHDIRRTVGTWLKTSGVDLHTIGRVLGHSNPTSTRIYARLDTEPLRPLLEANARLMRIGIRRKALSKTA